MYSKEWYIAQLEKITEANKIVDEDLDGYEDPTEVTDTLSFISYALSYYPGIRAALARSLIILAHKLVYSL